MESDEDGVLSDGVDTVQKSTMDYPKKGRERGRVGLVIPRLEEEQIKGKTAKGKIVIMKPEGEEKVVNKFMGSSMQVAKLLDKSEFNEALINNVRSNFKMKYLTIEIKEEKYMKELLKVKKLGEYNVTCRQPTSHVEVKGVIEPIVVFNSEEEIKVLINEQNSVKVEKVIRLNRGREKNLTTSIKLVFHGDNLPGGG